MRTALGGFLVCFVGASVVIAVYSAPPNVRRVAAAVLIGLLVVLVSGLARRAERRP